MTETVESGEAYVLGQKRAYGTASLLVGIACYIQLLGVERAILAIVFAWLALRSRPEPSLKDGRLRGKVGFVLGLVMLLLVPTVLIICSDRIGEIVEALRK